MSVFAIGPVIGADLEHERHEALAQVSERPLGAGLVEVLQHDDGVRLVVRVAHRSAALDEGLAVDQLVRRCSEARTDDEVGT